MQRKVDLVVNRRLKNRTVELYRETIDLNKQDFYEALEAVEKLYPKDIISPEHWVVKTNLMTGKEYLEAPNTPLACSPASETYWSM